LPHGTDLVVRALPAAHGASYAELVADLHHCLRDDLVDDDLVNDELGYDEFAHDEFAHDNGDQLNLRSKEPITVEKDTVPQQKSPSAGTSPRTSSGTSSVTPRTGISRVLFILGTPLRWLLIGLVTVYRQVISPVLPPTCRYHPSCSAYALESLQVHGAIKGVVLAAWRLGRCNPFTKGGLDPVPTRGAWRPDIHPDGTPRHSCTDPGGRDTTPAAVGLPHNPGAFTFARSPEA
jgi:putative membrane protein insertion efficiency factor